MLSKSGFFLTPGRIVHYTDKQQQILAALVLGVQENGSGEAEAEPIVMLKVHETNGADYCVSGATEGTGPEQWQPVSIGAGTLSYTPPPTTPYPVAVPGDTPPTAMPTMGVAEFVEAVKPIIEAAVEQTIDDRITVALGDLGLLKDEPGDVGTDATEGTDGAAKPKRARKK